MAAAKDAGDSNQTTQIIFGVIIVLGLIGIGVGPVQTWIRKAQKYSLKAGLKNLRDAYSAYIVQKSAIPSDDLSELKVANGGNIAEWPVDNTSGTGQVVVKLNGKGGWYHDKEKREIKLNKFGKDYFGDPYSEY